MTGLGQVDPRSLLWLRIVTSVCATLEIALQLQRPQLLKSLDVEEFLIRVRSRLREAKLFVRRPVQRKVLTAHRMEDRLQWCQERESEVAPCSLENYCVHQWVTFPPSMGWWTDVQECTDVEESVLPQPAFKKSTVYEAEVSWCGQKFLMMARLILYMWQEIWRVPGTGWDLAASVAPSLTLTAAVSSRTTLICMLHECARASCAPKTFSSTMNCPFIRFVSNWTLEGQVGSMGVAEESTTSDSSRAPCGTPAWMVDHHATNFFNLDCIHEFPMPSSDQHKRRSYQILIFHVTHSLYQLV